MSQIRQVPLNQWRMKQADEDEWMAAKVPGCVHTDLLRNGKIPDPFRGTNEQDLQWIEQKNWEYVSEFELPDGADGCDWAELVFKGLDTYAECWLNGISLLQADNMFREWTVDVRDALQTGTNTLRVLFRSPVGMDLPKLRGLGYPLPATNDQSELGGLGEDRISIFARKAPYHYGWDWGPRFVTAGIWREAYLNLGNGVEINDIYMKQKSVTAERADLTAVVELRSAAGRAGTLRVAADGVVREQRVRLEPGHRTLKLDIELPKPRLWWSRGLGEPAMTDFAIAFVGDDGTEATAQARTGLREIRLIREPDEQGASFYFMLNGVPVFAKGANHIPNDSFPSEVTEERYRYEIASAAYSGMNMIRVWGGGYYEDDAFYRLCDEYGLLVWQDFMFACSMYPGNPEFLESVRQEAVCNIKRLRNHPCLALWCGNNEIDSAWAHYGEDMGWGWKKDYNQEQREEIWAAYEAIFHMILPQTLKALHQDVAYWPSSPLRGLTGDDRQHAIAIASEGDVHYWGVWHADEPFENYNVKVGRFMSEYGFQSFPEIDTVLRYAEEEDLELESPVMTAHQKNGTGNIKIKSYMERYLPEPKDFRGFLYLSQVLQAEGIRVAIESHRRHKPYCMGTLYWQLNDCWPVASWAGIDYYGRWKALQYAVRRSFREIILSVVEQESGALDVYAVSDRRTPVEGELRIALHDARGGLLQERTLPAALDADVSAWLCSLPAGEWQAGRKREDIIVHLSLSEGEELLDEKIFFGASARDRRDERPKIEVKETLTPDGAVYTVSTNLPARSVRLTSSSEGFFTDNFFDLLPGEPRTVGFLRRCGLEESEALAPARAADVAAHSMADFIAEAVR
ncbi:beta-mannosidase [Paenibacillus glufosinatiresistens]|uniref:beta-mannosidase n=1 Tax=Paenibacillus glufosinatiresistens TaxID=3070657 RepID=UPI00286DEA2C|nr:glycoside hydrolase family 2 protein [Paenibacillus sp. YX.27]